MLRTLWRVAIAGLLGIGATSCSSGGNGNQSGDAGGVPTAGMTWTQRGGARDWTSVASSADGTKLVAVVGRSYHGYIYT